MVAYFLASVSSTMAVANAALPAFVGIMVFLIGLIITKEGAPASLQCMLIGH